MFSTTQQTATELQARLFRGFSDPARLAILRALIEAPRNVTELAAATGLSQSNASNHLRCLRDCGLVNVDAQGRFAWYSLSDQRIRQLLQLADEILAEAANGFYQCTRYTEPEA